MHLALGRVERASQFRRSRARGVAKTRNVIPMLGGKHYFFWSPCCVGVPILLFSTPLRRECSKTCFPENFQMIYWVFVDLLIMGAACCGTFNVELRKRASHPAWGSHFGFPCSMGELLRCERFNTTCKNVLPTCVGITICISMFYLCMTAMRRSCDIIGRRLQELRRRAVLEVR